MSEWWDCDRALLQVQIASMERWWCDAARARYSDSVRGEHGSGFLELTEVFCLINRLESHTMKTRRAFTNR